MLKNIIKHISTGLAIGFIATTVCMWLFGAYEAEGMQVMRCYTVWLLASALYGIISFIYDANLPLWASIPIHFALCLCVTFGASYGAGLMKFMSPSQWFIFVLPVFIIIYAIIGITSLIYERHQEKVINQKIGNKN